MRIAATVIGIAIALIGLGIDFFEIVPPALVVSETNPVARSLPDALVWFWTYFTHLSNLGLLLVYVATLTRWGWLGWFARPQTRAAFGGYILLVMIYYHVALAPLYTFEGAMLVSTYTLHYVAPVYYLLWWATCTPHGALRYREVGWMLIPGLAYLAWTQLRGLVVGEYPYEIISPLKGGYGIVAIGVAALILAVLVLCLVMISADKLLARLRKT